MRRAGAAAMVACALTLAACGAARPSGTRPPTGRTARTVAAVLRPTRRARAPAAAAPRGHGAPGSFAVGERVLALVDRSRTVRLPGHGVQPRALTTVVRYPVAGPSGRVDVRDAPPDTPAGPFPLVVFGHGFAVTPATYFRLERAWAAAGFVVAAPVFPLENAHAPGGPDERDLVNQPRDMRFVIGSLLAAAGRRGGWASGLIARRAVAVAGQSDGGETALAVAYDRAYRDPRVRAAVLLSGAYLPAAGRASLVADGPPLLAVQGTADTINLPVHTYAFFAAASRPKFLLTLLDAPHLPPYTDEQPQLTIVERASIAFLRAYLEHRRGELGALRAAAHRPGIAQLVARP